MDAIMEKFKLLYEGKVREVYDIGDKLVIAATDRISAFDHILKNKVTDKGAHHTSSCILFILEEFRHIININRYHMIRNNILSIIKPE